MLTARAPALRCYSSSDRGFQPSGTFPPSLELIPKLSFKLIQKAFSKKTVRGEAEGSVKKGDAF